MTSIIPPKGFVTGNTLVTIGFSYFFDLTSNRATCKFTSLDDS